MPSVSDLASCSTLGSSGGEVQGCDGGNSYNIWEWMRTLNRNVWTMSATCLPNNLKCWQSEPGSVVNPMASGFCKFQANLQMWYRDCSCIPNADKPTKYVCPTAPSASCGFSVPVMMFDIMNLAHGLSNADAVLNMQRHIQETGPIYVSYDATSAFMGWDWTNNPVYTGGGSIRGGHAVVAVGWGTDAKSGTDYWLLRNSWGGDWAARGYFKFQRGINLDKLEASETTGVMVSSNYANWSPPQCDLSAWNWKWTNAGTTLLSYSLTMTIACNTAATVTTFVSQLLTSQDQIYTGSISGYYTPTLTMTATALLVTQTVDVMSLGFGFMQGDMWINIAAVDSAGNGATVDRFISIPQVPNVKQR